MAGFGGLGVAPGGAAAVAARARAERLQRQQARNVAQADVLRERSAAVVVRALRRFLARRKCRRRLLESALDADCGVCCAVRRVLVVVGIVGEPAAAVGNADVWLERWRARRGWQGLSDVALARVLGVISSRICLAGAGGCPPADLALFAVLGLAGLDVCPGASWQSVVDLLLFLGVRYTSAWHVLWGPAEAFGILGRTFERAVADAAGKQEVSLAESLGRVVCALHQDTGLGDSQRALAARILLGTPVAMRAVDRETQTWAVEVALKVSMAPFAAQEWTRAFWRAEPGAESLLAVVGNMLDAVAPVAGKHELVEAADWIADALEQLAGMQAAVTSGPAPDVAFHPLLRWTAGSSLPAPNRRRVLEVLESQVAQLWSDESIRELFPESQCAMWTMRNLQVAPDSVTTRTQRVRVACRIYTGALAALPQIRERILARLAAYRALAPFLWRVLLTVDDCGQWSVGGTSMPWGGRAGGSLGPLLAEAGGPGLSGTASVGTLHLLAWVMPRHLLVVLDDEVAPRAHDETFAKPVALLEADELRALSLFATALLFTLVFDNKTSSLVDTPLFEPLRFLAQTLHERNERAQLPWVERAALWAAGPTSAKRFWRDFWDGGARERDVVALLPWAVPFPRRLELFRELVRRDRAALPAGAFYPLRVSRGSCFTDAFRQLGKLTGAQLRHRVVVQFVNTLGLPEAGVDAFGLFKEFIACALQEAFHPDCGLFKWTPADDGTVYFSADGAAAQGAAAALAYYEFLGRLVGKAVYEGLVVDFPFPAFLYSKLLGHHCFLDELPGYDPALYRSLLQVKRYVGDCAALELTFSVEESRCGVVHTTELRPGGAAVAVTNANRYEYVHLLAEYWLNRYCSDAVQAYLGGLTSVVSVRWLQLFSAAELRRVMAGDEAPLNIKDLEKHTAYDGGYYRLHPTVRAFWKFVHGLSIDDQRLLLQFVTSCARPPVGGFAHLQPPFTIRLVDPADSAGPLEALPPAPPARAVVSRFLRWAGLDAGVAKQYRLPTSATCFNLLKLPNYGSARVLSERLLYAIRSNSGFEQV